MKLYDSPTYMRELAEIAAGLDVSSFEGKRIFITGASGLIGSAVVDILVWCNLHRNTGILIEAAGRSVDALAQRFCVGAEAGISFINYDASKPFSFTDKPDFVICAASNASPDLYVGDPVGTLCGNILGLKTILDGCVEKQVGRLLYVSSSEVYGPQDTSKPLSEDLISAVNPVSVRSCYPIGKLAAQNLCQAYLAQYGVETVIVRPGHIYGPTARPADKRVSSLFPAMAAAGQPIVMKSAGQQLRSYCHCLDCATAILHVLAQGVPGEAYNISNPDSIITIAQMARILCDYAGVELIFDLPADQEKQGFNVMSNSSLTSDKLQSLGWKGQIPAQTGFRHMIDILRELSRQ